MSSDRKIPDDHELEDFLAGRHPAGKAYREATAHETAPRELDVLILGAAREAVRTPRPRRPRWVQPMAVAATLALSLGVLLNLWRDPVTRHQLAPTVDAELGRMRDTVREEATPVPDAVSKKIEEAPRPASAIEAPREPAPEGKLGMSKESFDYRVEQPSEVEAGKSKRAAAAGNAAAAPVIAETHKLEPQRRALADTMSDRSSGPSPEFVPEPPSAAKAAPAPPPPPPARALFPSESRQSPSTGLGGLSAHRDDMAPAEVAKDEKQARGALESTQKQRVFAQDQDARATGSSAAPPSAPATTAVPSAEPAAKATQREFSESESADAAAVVPQEDWFRRMRELRLKGDETGARDLLKRFREVYPDVVLPQDLRTLEAR